MGTLPPAGRAEPLPALVLADLAEAAGDGILVLDGGGRVVSATAAVGVILDRAPADLLGGALVDHALPAARPAMRAQLAAAAGRAAARWDTLLLRPDGAVCAVECTARPARIGARGRLVVVVRDVTEARQHARQAQALADIAASLTVDQPVAAMLDRVAAAAVETTAAVACPVMLVDSATLALRLVSAHGLPPGYAAVFEAGWATERGDSAGVRALTARQPRIVRHLRRDALANPAYAALHPFLADWRWETLAMVPLVYREQSLGLLNAYLPADAEPAAADMAFLQALADQAAVAIANGQLYAAARETAALQERQRLARELHDSVSQALFGIALGAGAARRRLELDPAKVGESLDYVLSLTEVALTEMRALIFELRPETLEKEGLVAALTRHAAATQARHEIPVETALGAEPDVPLATKEALYRIAQEAMHNAAKYARGTRIDLILEHGADQLLLEVRDDGIGFDATQDFVGHLGLHSMRERMAALGGTTDVTSTLGVGTCIRAAVPSR
jgi:PAS domain S-box-containing protein